MNRKNFVLANPVTGEWARELVSAEETGGAYVMGETIARPACACRARTAIRRNRRSSRS